MGLAILRRGDVAVVPTPHSGVNETMVLYLQVIDGESWHERCFSSTGLRRRPAERSPLGVAGLRVEMPGGHHLAPGGQIS
jgi:hypothetical protein